MHTLCILILASACFQQRRGQVVWPRGINGPNGAMIRFSLYNPHKSHR